MGWAVPSVSEASLTLFGTRHLDVLPRRASAEVPLTSLGVTKKERARGDKKREGSGQQKVAFGAIKGALRDLIVILFYL
jgi:hypothetical protein